MSKKNGLELIIEHVKPKSSAMNFKKINEVKAMLRTMIKFRKENSTSGNLDLYYFKSSIRDLREGLISLKASQGYFKITLKSDKHDFEAYDTAKNISGTHSIVSSLYRSYKRGVQRKRENMLMNNYRYTRTIYVGGSRTRLVGLVNTKPNIFLNAANAVKSKAFRESCSPSNEDTSKYVGVEMEFLSLDSVEELSSEFFALLPELANKLTIKRDGSIYNNGISNDYSGVEIAILDTESNIKNTVKQVTDLLTKLDCKTNRTCGIHVHLDVRNRDHKTVFHNLCTFQKYMYAMNPKSRKNGQYSKLTRGKDFDKHIRGNGYNSRYKGVNAQSYRNYKTIEVRMHCATLSDTKINYWVNILTNIANLEDKVMRCPVKIEKFFDIIKLNEDAQVYVKSRIAKFAEAS